MPGRVGAHVYPSSEGLDQRRRFRHELLNVIDGSLEVEVYNSAGGFVENVLLSRGNTILLTEGHSTRFLDRTYMFEVKEGVYPGKEDDKFGCPRKDRDWRVVPPPGVEPGTLRCLLMA